ncbi:iron-hydroxamate ABC transporter substrate-binding protein [Gorillibacterium sp. CAU 1737]|uniref:iron-hydroxamate ABC transporter substrate-binding protein n=1 Tax=Gorillibacterium sp. CAU 1737 TaxID=3140362 RepID=UPI003261944E
MKKLTLPLIMIFLLVLSACGNGKSADISSTSPSASPSATTAPASASPAASNSDTITYQSENGPVEVPAHPKRVVVLSSYAGSVLALGVPVVGVDSWAKMNPRFEDKLKDAVEVSDENIEKILELEPDLIIGLSTIKNVDKLKEIAPTVTFTYGKLDYLAQHVEIGKLLNKGEEAQAWADDFRKREQEAGDEIRAKLGQNTSVSVIENFSKQLYLYGDHWGRGTEILYQGMKLVMPDKVKEATTKDGYFALSAEVLPDYTGDYLIVSKDPDTDNSYQDTETYKTIPAVKNQHVLEVPMKEFYFNDAITLEYQLETFKEFFLGHK